MVFEISEDRICQEIAGYLKIGAEDWFNDHSAIAQLFWHMVASKLIRDYEMVSRPDECIISIQLRFKIPHGWGDLVTLPPESFARFVLQCLRLNEDD